MDDPGPLPAPHSRSRPTSMLRRLSSLDHILQHRDEKTLEKQPFCTFSVELDTPASSEPPSGPPTAANSTYIAEGFRSTASEAAFCAAMALSQLTGEYLLSGFSVLWARFPLQHAAIDFWPATLLSLISGATILIFARLADVYGGYQLFMLGNMWLIIWTLIAGFAKGIVLLDVCRAMQGLAFAAYTPSCTALFGTVYPSGKRKNITLGFYAATPPLGFFVGIMVSAALPPSHWPWYFWIAAVLAAVALVLAYVGTPIHQNDHCRPEGPFDSLGALTSVAGLILTVYALSAGSGVDSAWRSPAVLAPLVIGLACLAAAVYIEGWRAASPILPFDFFCSGSISAFSAACICFYACFGIWLFTATQFFESQYSVNGIKLAIWFAPMAATGVIIAIASSSILHLVSPVLLLLISGIAWLAAPLLLALAGPSAGYWRYPFPSVICGSLGIDLTFTVSVILLSSVQPKKYQGLAGAVCSLLVNLGMAIGLAFAQLVERKVNPNNLKDDNSLAKMSRAAFLLATGFAGLGLIIAVCFVRTPKVDGETET